MSLGATTGRCLRRHRRRDSWCGRPTTRLGVTCPLRVGLRAPARIARIPSPGLTGQINTAHRAGNTKWPPESCSFSFLRKRERQRKKKNETSHIYAPNYFHEFSSQIFFVNLQIFIVFLRQYLKFFNSNFRVFKFLKFFICVFLTHLTEIFDSCTPAFSRYSQATWILKFVNLYV